MGVGCQGGEKKGGKYKHFPKISLIGEGLGHYLVYDFIILAFFACHCFGC